ncbi:hypothetical protein ACJX0J_040842, partial [Zea mays]
MKEKNEGDTFITHRKHVIRKMAQVEVEVPSNKVTKKIVKLLLNKTKCLYQLNHAQHMANYKNEQLLINFLVNDLDFKLDCREL